MIQVQILVGDLHRGHVRSDDAIWGHIQLFANNSCLKRPTGRGPMGVVSLCLSCQDASTDQLGLFGSFVTLPDLDIRSILT